MLLTSFGKINNDMKEEHTIDWVFSSIVNDKLDPDSHTAKTESNYIFAQREAMLTMIKFIDNFEKNFPHKKLMISVKPGENLSFWENYFSKRNFKNIFLRRDYSIPTNYYILAADNVISSNSTVLLEAYLLKKKTINVLGETPQRADIDLLTETSYVVRNYNQLKNTYQDLIDNKNNFLNIDQKLKFSIHNTKEDYDIFEKILNEIDKIEISKITSIFRDKNAHAYILILNVFRDFKRMVKRFLFRFFSQRNYNIYEKLHTMKVGTKLDKNNFLKLSKNSMKLKKLRN